MKLETLRKFSQFLRAIVGVLLLVGAVIIFVVLVRTKPVPAPSSPEDTLQRVTVVKAVRAPVARQWRGYGSAEALHAADVPAQVTAVVAELPDSVRAGQPIQKGELIVKLDDVDVARNLDVAQQQLQETQTQLATLAVEKETLQKRLALQKQDLEIAQRELDRVEDLLRKQASTPREVDQVRKQLLQMQQNLLATEQALADLPARTDRLTAQIQAQRSLVGNAREQLARTTITSPLTGIVQTVDVKLGESLMPGQRVARVVDLRQMEIPIRLPAVARPDVRPADQVRLESDGGNAHQWVGRIARIAPESDAQTRTFTIYVELEQEAPPKGGTTCLWPGTFVAATVEGVVDQQRLIVPRRAVRNGRLYIVDPQQRVHGRNVDVDFVLDRLRPETGLPDLQWAVLSPESSGPDGAVSEGDMIVVVGTLTLQDGQMVEPVIATDASVQQDISTATTASARSSAEEAMP